MRINNPKAKQNVFGAMATKVTNNDALWQAGGCLGVVVLVLAAIAFCVAFAAVAYFVLGSLTGLVMSHFGINQPNWVWAIAWFLVFTLLGAAKNNSNSRNDSNAR